MTRRALLIARGDDALILGHRLSEWTGRAPVLEEELALANMALDLIGQARTLFQETGEDEDRLAYLRDDRDFKNLLMCELPNGDYAHTIARLAFYSAWALLWWRAAAADPADAFLAALGEKAAKETEYHWRHAGEWLVRLGDGTEESHARAQAAVDALFPYCGEFFGADARVAPAAWDALIDPLLARATLQKPAPRPAQTGGRIGRHTEHLSRLLAEMQVLARAHQGAVW